MKNKLILIEGLDGSGKTTLIHALQKELTLKKICFKVYQGLGSGSGGPEIRNLFLHLEQITYQTRFFLSIANMIQMQEELFLPQLQKKSLIILDRWLPSTFAYQIFPYGKSLNPVRAVLKAIFNQIHQDILLKPDLLVYLDIDPHLGLTRKQMQMKHHQDVIEQKPLHYFHQVRKGYYQYLTQYPRGLKLILDGTAPIANNVDKIMRLIRRK